MKKSKKKNHTYINDDKLVLSDDAFNFLNDIDEDTIKDINNLIDFNDDLSVNMLLK
jgi:hypothetical protein